jgi:FemAB-related protein (PEP-CTERM system-associated)
MTEIKINILAPSESGHWPDKLIRLAGYPATDAWSSFIQQIYNFPVFRIEAQQGDKILGLLVLFWVRHPIFGNYLTTAPFGSYGGFSFASTGVRNALLGEAKRLCLEIGAQHIVVRFISRQDSPPPDWQPHPVYATFLIDLETDTENLLLSYSSNHRNHIRKSQKRNLQIRFGHLELLDNTYKVLARSMHELGSPYHSKAYLKAMAEALNEKLEFAVVYDKAGMLVGGGVLIFHDQVVTNLHANILRKYRSSYAGEFLYWSIIERYYQQGLSVFDLGRSLIGSGNEVFKMKWNPRKELLAYWYYLSPGNNLPDLNQNNPKFQLAIKIWKHLPAPIVRLLGPALIRGLA